MTLSTRVTIAMIAVTLLTAAAGGIFTYIGLESRLRPVMLGQMAIRAGQLTNAADATIRAGQADVEAFIASQTIKGLMNATLAGGTDPELGIGIAQWRSRLETAFVTQLGAKPAYHQMRLIGVANGGRELVRVDRMGEGNTIRVVPDGELAMKGDRDYFQKAVELGRGQIYLGRAELNRERGTLTMPHIPILRVAAPVHTEAGAPFGIVIINLDLRVTFDLLRSLVGDRSRVFAVNRNGDYLLHPDPSKEFGFEVGQPHRLFDDFPGAPSLQNLNTPTAAITTTSDGSQFALALAPIPPAGADLMTIVEIEPYTSLMMPLGTVETSTLGAGFASALITLLIAIIISRSLTRPFRRVAEQLEDFGRGVIRPPLVHGPSEVVRLSGALDHMSREIQSRTRALEDEIAVRRRTEAALNDYVDMARLFTAVVESSDDAILSTNLDGIITSWNPAAERLYGYRATEALGNSIEIIIPSDRTTENARLMERITGGERIPGFQTVRRHRDGHVIDVALTLSPIVLDSGRISGVSAIARDISRRLQDEERFRLVVESAPNGIVMVDGDGVVQLVNRETERLFGYHRDELLGRSMEILVPQRYRAQHPRLRKEFTSDPAGRPMGEGRDLFGLRKDGSEFPIEVGLNPIHTRLGMMVLSVIVDITERKRSEAEIQRHTEDLKRSNRELETFAYAASHDLQEPLRMVASYVELLAKRYQGRLDEKADKYIYYAVDGATRMKQLINDLLAYSRVSTQGKPLEPVDPNIVVAHIVHSLQGLIRDTKAEISWEELPMVMADSVQLGQVLQNLIVNAIKFHGEAPPRVHVGAAHGESGLEFRVRDNGIGIDPKFGERVFQMFQRLNTREEYPGTGIGLAIAQKIVERHGGHIWFTANDSGGCTFHFTIQQT